MPFISKWAEAHRDDFATHIVHHPRDAVGGDFLFLISASHIVGEDVRANYDHTLVVHSSDLPKGRGWSPQAWSVIEGDDKLVVSMLEAEEPVDSGRIWRKIIVALDGTELFAELHEKLYTSWIALLDWAVENAGHVVPKEQTGEPTYLRKRTPDDSELDAEKSIAEQFDLLRVCDPRRFPAFFDFRGQRYILRIEKDGRGQ